MCPLCLTCMRSFGCPPCSYKLLIWLKWLLATQGFACPSPLELLHRIASRFRNPWEQRCKSAPGRALLLLDMQTSKQKIIVFRIYMRDHPFIAEMQHCDTRVWEHPAVTQLGEAEAACPRAVAEGCSCRGLCRELWGISSRHAPAERAELFVRTSVLALSRTLPLLRLAPKQTPEPKAEGF